MQTFAGGYACGWKVRKVSLPADVIFWPLCNYSGYAVENLVSLFISGFGLMETLLPITV